jgi:hypothetical protein
MNLESAEIVDLLERYKSRADTKLILDDLDHLQHGGGSGTSGSMDAVDAKIAAAEARTDTKFSELLGEMRLMNQRLDHVERSTSGMRSTVIGTGIGVVAVVIAIMAYGAQWFGIGMDAQQVSDRAVQSALSKVEPKMNDLDVKLDQLLQTTRPRPVAPQP